MPAPHVTNKPLPKVGHTKQEKKQYNVTFSHDVALKIEKAAKGEGRTSANWLRKAVLSYLEL